MAGWDVVNEPVAEDCDGLRDCHWSRALGMYGYMVRAFKQAKAADPDAVLFLNEYNLENIPRKGATFLKLVERLLKLGAPIGGIGTQSHLDIEIPAGQITRFMRDAASLGLPIHVSELDFPMQRDGGRMPDLRSTAERRAQQVARVGELAEAFMALPERQRYAFTTWGLRDTDSWLVRAEGKNRPDESALLLDASGRANPAFQAVAEAFQR
jgi:endo-1,4-beta-xylanase